MVLSIVLHQQRPHLFLISNFGHVLNVVFFYSGWFPSVWILYAHVPEHSVCSIFIGLWRWNRQSVLRHWHIKFRCWGITEKKEYNKDPISYFFIGSCTVDGEGIKIPGNWLISLLQHCSVISSLYNFWLYTPSACEGHAVAQLVEALCYKPEGRGFISRWCHWNFSLT